MTTHNKVPAAKTAVNLRGRERRNIGLDLRVLAESKPADLDGFPRRNPLPDGDIRCGKNNAVRRRVNFLESAEAFGGDKIGPLPGQFHDALQRGVGVAVVAEKDIQQLRSEER